MNTIFKYPALKIGFCAGIFLLMCISCASVQTDIFYSDETVSANIKTLEAIELRLVQYTEQLEPEAIADMQKEINILLNTPSADSSYLAYLYALAADIHLLQNKRAAARKKLAAAKQYNEYEEYVMLIHARLIPGIEDRKAYLETCTKQDSKRYRLLAELAALYFQSKDYRRALAAFDASLDFLPEAYRQRYRKQREQSVQLYTLNTAALQQQTEVLLQADCISLIDMAALTQESTTALDFITGTEKWKPPMLAKKLQQQGWYNTAKDVTSETAAKKDAALFLWHLLTGTNEKNLKRYSRFYANKRKLPIPDVPFDGLYFDSIVGTVEEDIIPLADGKHFQPDAPVSGMEFYRWLLKAEELRR